MSTISISQLKINPSKCIDKAIDYPLAVQNRNKTKAYLIGSQLFEKIISFLEEIEDNKAVKSTNFNKRIKFEKIASELGI